MGDLETLAFKALQTLGTVAEVTSNRKLQAANQQALLDFVRGLATVRFSEVAGTETYRDGIEAVRTRDTASGALDERATVANTDTFTSLRALRAGVVEHVDSELRRLPPVIQATPATVQPSLVVAYDVYEDVDRADEIVGRIALPRPGFVPANPITLPSE